MQKNSDITKNKILDSALQNFGDFGYALTSTNQICLDANVSKGLIFKYFKNKAHLFYAVFVREIDQMLSLIDKEVQLDTLEVYEKIVAVTLWKIAYAQHHPASTKVLSEAITSPPEVLRPLIEKEIGKLSILSIERFFADIDVSRLRDDVTYEDFLRNIQVSLIGLQNFYVKNNPSFVYQDAVRKQCLDYMAVVIRGMEK